MTTTRGYCLTRWIEREDGDGIVNAVAMAQTIKYRDASGAQFIPPEPNVVLVEFECYSYDDLRHMVEDPDVMLLTCDAAELDLAGGGRFEARDREAVAAYLAERGVDESAIDNAIGTRHQILKRSDVVARLGRWINTLPLSDQPLQRMEPDANGRMRACSPAGGNRRRTL